MSRQTTAHGVDLEEFRATFIRGGWRQIERNYAYSSEVLNRLIDAAGRKALLDARAAAQVTGRRAGGKAA